MIKMKLTDCVHLYDPNDHEKLIQRVLKFKIINKNGFEECDLCLDDNGHVQIKKNGQHNLFFENPEDLEKLGHALKVHLAVLQMGGYYAKT